MFAQDEKIIRKTFTKRSKKNLLWNEQVTIPCDIFEALPEPFNIHFFSARGKKYVAVNVRPLCVCCCCKHEPKQNYNIS